MKKITFILVLSVFFASVSSVGAGSFGSSAIVAPEPRDHSQDSLALWGGGATKNFFGKLFGASKNAPSPSSSVLEPASVINSLASAIPQKVFGYAGIDLSDFSSGALKSITTGAVSGPVPRQGSVAIRDLKSIAAAGIPTNTVVLGYEVTSQVPKYNAMGKRPIIIADLLIFIQDAKINTPCKPWSMRLRQNWKARINDYIKANGKYLTINQIAGFVIDSEVNNGCIAPETVDMVAKYLRTKLPANVPLAVGEGASTGAKPFWPSVPASIDWVAVYDYDHEDLNSPQSQVDRLLPTLQPNQKYVLVPKGFLFFWEKDVPKWKLGVSTVNYAKYCAGDSRCVGVVVFLWNTVNWSEVDGTGLLGTDRMPQKWQRDAEAAKILGVL